MPPNNKAVLKTAKDNIMVSLLQLEKSSVAGPPGHQVRLRKTTTCCQGSVLTVRSQSVSGVSHSTHVGRPGVAALMTVSSRGARAAADSGSSRPS
jgi:hypothetical protein